MLYSLEIRGTIPGRELKPVVFGRTIGGPATTLRYIPERNTVGQSFQEKAKAKLADRDAYLIAKPGDIVVVVVIDIGGSGDVSCMGGLSALCTVRRQLAWGIAVINIIALRGAVLLFKKESITVEWR